MARRRARGPKPVAEYELYPSGITAHVPPIPRVVRTGTVRNHIEAIEAIALAYGSEHARSHSIRPAYLARVTLNALAVDAGYVPGCVASGGRWSTRPPNPLVLAARDRLDPPPTAIAPPSVAAEHVPF